MIPFSGYKGIAPLNRWFQKTRLLLPGLIVGLCVVFTPVLVAFEPVHDEQAAVIFPPGWSNRDVLLASARANLSVVRFGSLQNIGIINLDTPEAIASLRQEGALFLLSPGALGGCLVRTINPSTQNPRISENQI